MRLLLCVSSAVGGAALLAASVMVSLRIGTAGVRYALTPDRLHDVFEIDAQTGVDSLGHFRIDDHAIAAP